MSGYFDPPEVPDDGFFDSDGRWVEERDVAPGTECLHGVGDDLECGTPAVVELHWRGDAYADMGGDGGGSLPVCEAHLKVWREGEGDA